MLLQYFGLHMDTKEAIATEALLVAFAVFVLSTVVLYFLIPVLRAKKIGQTIYELGPSWHMDKQGVPTMGGIGFIPPFLLVLAVFAVLYLIKAGAASSSVLIPFALTLMLAVANAAIGFVDDYCKLLKKQNQGLTAWQKLLLQLVFAAAYVAMMAITGNLHTDLTIPFTHFTLQLGWLAYPAYIIVIAGFVNATNLTDGLDGLLSGTVAVVGVGYIALGHRGASGVFLFAGVLLLGAALGFLPYNLHPAKTFMGDTGSLFFGGLVAGAGLLSGRPDAVLLSGGIYVAEAASVILQVVCFKLSGGKRLFRMAPLHHHLEKCGWSENRIVLLFSLLTAGLVLLAMRLV